MIVGLVLVVAVAVGVVAVLLVGGYERGTDDAWTRASDQLGMQYTPVQKRLFGSAAETNRHLQGNVDGREVRVYTHTQGSGDNRSTYTEYEVDYPPLGLGLEISRQGIWGRVKKAFGSQDIEVGDEEFDDAFLVAGDDPDQVGAFLTPSRRVTISRLVTEFRNARIGDGGIRWQEARTQRDADVIVSTVRRLTAAANSLAGRQTPLLDEALERQRRGDLGEAARRVRAAVKESPDLETRRTAAEVLYAGGDLAAAAEEFEALAEALPVDDQVRAWKERLAVRRAGPAQPERPREMSTDPGAVADELFDADRLNFETARLFEEAYQGTPIRWSGELVRATGYRSDLDFRTGPGTKAVFHVHNLSSSLYAGRNVEAVVELPADLADDLRGRRGESFTFTGILHRIDPLMRNLYVRDGRLV